MADEFQVQVLAVETRAGVVAQRQAVCAPLADPWAGAARAVITGDAGLDRRVAEVAAAGQRFGQVLGQVMAALGARMTEVAGNYRAGDAAAATAYRSLEELLGRPAAGKTESVATS
jgi:hypothetical protein